MSSDKISESLEQQLKTLGQKIRIDILKKLNDCNDSISFSMLQKKVLSTNSNSKNLSFHLNVLKKSDLITTNEYGYSITELGKKILTNILKIEQILNVQSNSIIIRTSKYSKEIFDNNKIVEYLIREGELDKYLARQIAQEVKERLSNITIEYLTAPLMREYINAILLENGLEQVRHKLTRLGTPPYEIYKLFEKSRINPENFIKKLGSETSEQFLLLNLLPNRLADLYLSGEILLTHLNYWSLRPLSIYLNADTILKKEKKIKNSKDLLKLILNFIDFLNRINPYISEDLLIGEFNNRFLSLFDVCKKEKLAYYIDILISQILRNNKKSQNINRSLSLEFSYEQNESNSDLFSNRFFVDNLVMNSLTKNPSRLEFGANPLILFDYSNLNLSNLNELFVVKDIASVPQSDLIFYNRNSSHLMNSTLVKIQNSKNHNLLNSQMILDKIFINLPLISLEANQNDDLFYELLQGKINSIFELFHYKELLISKKLKSSGKLERVLSDITEENLDTLIKQSLKSISFLGLNEAVKRHCNIELDRLETSESFALNILSYLNQLINERNEEKNEMFLLSQPHQSKYLFCSNHNSMNKIKKLNNYSSRIIRNNTKLDLIKQISLFKKFEKIIEGGSKFTCSYDIDNNNSKDILKVLSDSKLNAFSMC
ncbi:MAG: anaerobic ribonucleoside-triphosphate reductase [Promethearchaeota archaeon]